MRKSTIAWLVFIISFFMIWGIFLTIIYIEFGSKYELKDDFVISNDYRNTGEERLVGRSDDGWSKYYRVKGLSVEEWIIKDEVNWVGLNRSKKLYKKESANPIMNCEVESISFMGLGSNKKLENIIKDEYITDKLVISSFLSDVRSSYVKYNENFKYTGVDAEFKFANIDLIWEANIYKDKKGDFYLSDSNGYYPLRNMRVKDE